MTATARRRISDNEARPDPIAIARALHARFGIVSPKDIEVELIAFRHGATVRWRPTGSADARVVLVGDRATFAIAAHARGTPRARFSIAHELGHLLMHRDFDAITRIHGRPRTERREFRVENDADRFASELLVPHALAESTCLGVAEPTLDHVGDLAREYRVSLTVAAMRWPTMSRAPCAFFEAKNGVVRRAVRSPSFRGEAFGRRTLEEGSLAKEILASGGASAPHEPRVHEAAWGSRAIGAPIVEQCVPVAEGVVVGWLSHG